MSDDRSRVLDALDDAGVAGSQDFGRFVNNTDYFAPSAFDERAAMPVLLALLPSLTDARTVSSVAGHLRRPWARPSAFEALLHAYRRFGTANDSAAGWHLADALLNAATAEQADEVLELAAHAEFGRSRQMLVGGLWRFRADARVPPVLASLCTDPTVALHAMSSYRRTVGNEAALPLLRELLTHADALVRKQAAAQVKKAEKALLKSG